MNRRHRYDIHRAQTWPAWALVAVLAGQHRATVHRLEQRAADQRAKNQMDLAHGSDMGRIQAAHAAADAHRLALDLHLYGSAR